MITELSSWCASPSRRPPTGSSGSPRYSSPGYTCGEHQRDRLGQQPARHKRQRLRRGPVQSLRGIYHAQKGLLLSHL
jgi:hypothetical protein